MSGRKGTSDKTVFDRLGRKSSKESVQKLSSTVSSVKRKSYSRSSSPSDSSDLEEKKRYLQQELDRELEKGRKESKKKTSEKTLQPAVAEFVDKFGFLRKATGPASTSSPESTSSESDEPKRKKKKKNKKKERSRKRSRSSSVSRKTKKKEKSKKREGKKRSRSHSTAKEKPRRSDKHQRSPKRRHISRSPLPRTSITPTARSPHLVYSSRSSPKPSPLRSLSPKHSKQRSPSPHRPAKRRSTSPKRSVNRRSASISRNRHRTPSPRPRERDVKKVVSPGRRRSDIREPRRDSRDSRRSPIEKLRPSRRSPYRDDRRDTDSYRRSPDYRERRRSPDHRLSDKPPWIHKEKDIDRGYRGSYRGDERGRRDDRGRRALPLDDFRADEGDGRRRNKPEWNFDKPQQENWVDWGPPGAGPPPAWWGRPTPSSNRSEESPSKEINDDPNKEPSSDSLLPGEVWQFVNGSWIKKSVEGDSEWQNMDLDAISDEELEEEKPVIVDALDVDWASLVSENTVVKTEIKGETTNRFSIGSLLSRLPICTQWLSAELASQVKELVDAEKDKETKVEKPSPLNDIGPYRRALCARRDLAMRRRLCSMAERDISQDSLHTDMETFKHSVELFKQSAGV